MATVCAAPLARAQAFPSRSISIVSGYPPGGPVDLFGRLAATGLAPVLGVPVVVESRPGASGTIAGEAVARAAPDGHTLLVTVPSLLTMVPFIMEKSRVAQADLAPVGAIAEAPMVLLVNPDVPVKSIREFLPLVAQGKLSFASAGNGTLPHLTAELFLSRVGSKALHIPYKGTAPALQDLVGGQVQFAIDNISPALPLIRAGRLRALAVTSRTRFPGLPAVPTLMESGVDQFNVSNWFALFAPARTSPEIIDTLARQLSTVVKSTEFAKTVVAQGATPLWLSPGAVASRISAEADQWAPLIRKLGIKAA